MTNKLISLPIKKIPTKKTDQECPIHHIPLVYVGKIKPFCEECVAEQVEQEKKDQIDSFKVSNARRVLKRDSLVDDSEEYDYTFETFKAQDGSKEAQIKHRAKIIAYEYIKDPDKKLHTIFYGTPGEGKTHLAMSILNAVNDNSLQRCLFVDMNTLFDRIMASWRNPQELWTKEYAIKKLSSVDLLVLDDVGSESSMNYQNMEASNFTQEILKKVLDKQKRLIITTNLTTEQLQRAYNPKIVSRMFAYSKGHALDFSGIKDKRV